MRIKDPQKFNRSTILRFTHEPGAQMHCSIAVLSPNPTNWSLVFLFFILAIELRIYYFKYLNINKYLFKLLTNINRNPWHVAPLSQTQIRWRRCRKWVGPPKVDDQAQPVRPRRPSSAWTSTSIPRRKSGSPAKPDLDLRQGPNYMDYLWYLAMELRANVRFKRPPEKSLHWENNSYRMRLIHLCIL